MALPTTTNIENALITQVAPPKGWFADDEVKSSQLDAYNNTEEYVRAINSSLPQATKRSEELIHALDAQLEIIVSTAYLTIDADAAYHVFLLVTQDDYHSPHMQAAHLLVEKFTSNSLDLTVRFTFTVGREHVMSYLTSNEFKLKYIYSIEQPTGSLE